MFKTATIFSRVDSLNSSSVSAAIRRPITLPVTMVSQGGEPILLLRILERLATSFESWKIRWPRISPSIKTLMAGSATPRAWPSLTTRPEKRAVTRSEYSSARRPLRSTVALRRINCSRTKAAEVWRQAASSDSSAWHSSGERPLSDTLARVSENVLRMSSQATHKVCGPSASGCVRSTGAIPPASWEGVKIGAASKWLIIRLSRGKQKLSRVISASRNACVSLPGAFSTLARKRRRSAVKSSKAAN